MKRIKRFTILILINILVFTIIIAGSSCILNGSVTAFAEEILADCGKESAYGSRGLSEENGYYSKANMDYQISHNVNQNCAEDISYGMSKSDSDTDRKNCRDINYVLLQDTEQNSSVNSISDGLSQDADQSKKQSSLLDEVNIDDLDGEAKGQINSLYDYINKMKTNVELMQDLNPSDYINTYIKEGKGDISIDSIVKGILSLIFKEVKSVLKLVISIVTIVIICSLLKNLEEAFSNDNISQIAFYACYALMIMVLTKSFLISISVAKDVITNISDFMGALLPILITMIGVAGGFTQAASLDPIILICVVFIPKLYSNVIIPLILMSFVLEFANNLSTEHKISNLCSLIKQAVIWMQGIIITIFIAMLTIRGITSSTIDAVTLKTAKFAIDNFVPIVGKTFSDAISSVAGYSLIIKNAISSIGLLVIVLLMIYPIIKLTLMGLIYKLAGALVEPISDSRITKCLSSTGGAMTLIISCVLSVSLMFFILIAIMASSGKYVIGG